MLTLLGEDPNREGRAEAELDARDVDVAIELDSLLEVLGLQHALHEQEQRERLEQHDHGQLVTVAGLAVRGDEALDLGVDLRHLLGVQVDVERREGSGEAVGGREALAVPLAGLHVLVDLGAEEDGLARFDLEVLSGVLSAHGTHLFPGDVYLPLKNGNVLDTENTIRWQAWLLYC